MSSSGVYHATEKDELGLFANSEHHKTRTGLRGMEILKIKRAFKIGVVIVIVYYLFCFYYPNMV